MDEERQELRNLLRKGVITGARKSDRAHILLLADERKSDEDIASMLHTSVSTVRRTRQRFVEDSSEAAPDERCRPGKQRLPDGRQEVFLIALASGDPLSSRICRTMELLADRLAELHMAESVSDETVRRTSEKTR